MVSIEPMGQKHPASDEDQRAVVHGVTWMLYEVMLAARGDHAGPRMTYLEEELVLLSPSRGAQPDPGSA